MDRQRDGMVTGVYEFLRSDKGNELQKYRIGRLEVGSWWHESSVGHLCTPMLSGMHYGIDLFGEGVTDRKQKTRIKERNMMVGGRICY